MKHSTMLIIGILLFVAVNSSPAQQPKRDRAVIIESKNEFYDSLKSEAAKFKKKEEKKKRVLKVDFSGLAIPKSNEDFTTYWHHPPISQGISGMCWCFSTTSYFESEIYRLTKREIKLSELYTVYWEYVEKARRYVRERGDSEFGQGSESNAVPRMWKMYGIVPAEAYTGLQPGQKFHDHDTMFAEMKNYLTALKNSHAWNEEQAIATVKSIMARFIGEPPRTVVVDGKTMAPKEYLEKVVRLDLDDYLDFMSLMDKPYYQKVEYEADDNWWHSKDYHNVPLEEFMMILKRAVRKGYTVCIGGDTSEPGIEGHAGVAVVPTFDIPSEYIDENARQLRFSNKTTTDDHGIHIVGFTEKDGKDWFLVKDSGSGSRNGPHPGYYMYREDYVKLKMLGFVVHKDAVQDVLKKFH